MKIKLPWNKRSQKKDLIEVEKRISVVLKPVEPRPEFVKKLRAQLVGQQQRKVLGVTPERWQSGLLVVGGIVSAALMVMAGFRALVTLLGTLGLIRQVKKQMDENVPATQKPAI